MASKKVYRRGHIKSLPIITLGEGNYLADTSKISMKNATIMIDGRVCPVQIMDEQAKYLLRQHQPRPRTGFERAKNGEKYHSIVNGYCTEEYSDWDKNQYDSGDYVTDGQLSDAREVSWSIHNMLTQWQALHDEPINWNVTNYKGSIKWKIYCDYSATKPLLCVKSENFYRDAWAVYFSTKEKAQEALSTFHDQLMWYYTEYLPRLDAPPIVNKPSWVDCTKSMSRKVVNKNDLTIREEVDT